MHLVVIRNYLYVKSGECQLASCQFRSLSNLTRVQFFSGEVNHVATLADEASLGVCL